MGTSFRGAKTCKIGKKGCVFGHIDKFWKEHDRQIKKNACKNAYLGSVFIPEKYVIRVFYVSPWTSLIPFMPFECPPRVPYALNEINITKCMLNNSYILQTLHAIYVALPFPNHIPSSANKESSLKVHVLFLKIEFSVSFEASANQGCKFKISVEMVKTVWMYEAILYISVAYILLCRLNYGNYNQMSLLMSPKWKTFQL